MKGFTPGLFDRLMGMPVIGATSATVSLMSIEELKDTVARDLLRADTLPFSFTRPQAVDEVRAREDLNEAIAVMVAMPAVDAALAQATAALSMEGSEEEAFTRQVALSRQRRELEARLANLMLADEEEFDE